MLPRVQLRELQMPSGVVLALPEDDGIRPLKEVGYRCRACGLGWVRITVSRFVRTGVCPFCGAEGRMIRSGKKDGPSDRYEPGNVEVRLVTDVKA